MRPAAIARRVVLPLLLVAAWYLVTDVLRVFQSVLLPSPLAVARALVRLASSGELLEHIEASLVRVVQANALALGLGVPLGLGMGLYRPVEELCSGLLNMFRPIPPLAWIPLSILWLGIGALSVVFITFLAAFFAVLVNTIAGTKAVDVRHVRAAASLGASRLRLLTHVVLPSVLPHVFTGFRIAIGVSWMSIVAAELIAATSGLGYMISYYREVLRSDAIIVGMLTIGVIGLLMEWGLRRAERWLLPWREAFYLR